MNELDYPHRLRPLDAWGQETERRLTSKFSAAMSTTIGDLARELRSIHSRDVVIQLDVTEREVAAAGRLRTNHQPTFPGVIVSFSIGDEEAPVHVRYAMDRYKTLPENLRAIVLTLEALRAVSRYGVAQGNEQYRGWQTLHAPGESLNRITAQAFINQHGGSFREAAKRLHPDNPETGDAVAFQKLMEAKEAMA